MRQEAAIANVTGKTHGIEAANFEIQKNQRRYDKSI